MARLGFPIRELGELSERLHRLVEEWVPAWAASGRGGVYPAVDILEREDAYVVRAELPGVRKEDIRVTLRDNVLTIQGEKRRQSEERGETYHRIECAYGAFSRSFALPEEVDPSGVTARFENGVLEITLPRTQSGRAPKEVPVL
jgi:HSP20 family protein|nr:MAG: hypothetical protein KatS3mg041_1142 [Bacteroidota bacterium]